LIVIQKVKEKIVDAIVNLIKDDKSNTTFYAYPKEYSSQLLEVNNLADNLTQLKTFLAAIPEQNSINLHRTGNKRSYKLGFYFLLSGKNLIYRRMRIEYSEDIILNENWIYDEFLFNFVSMLNYYIYLFVINSFCWCNSIYIYNPPGVLRQSEDLCLKNSCYQSIGIIYLVS
jgi:hypothetical protein